MIFKGGKSFFTEKFSSMRKRLFILLLFTSVLLTYVVYDSNSRNSRLTRLAHLNIFKNSNSEVPGVVRSGTNGRPASTSKKHVDNDEASLERLSSDFTTLKKLTLASGDVQKTSSKENEEEIRTATQEIRGEDSSDAKGDLGLGVDRQRNISLPTAHDGQKRLLNSRSQVEDGRDSDFSDILEDGEDRKRLPNAIIIGVKKGGTRALLEILKIHPGIRACSNEVHFFDRDENYEQGLEWYRQQMPSSLPGQVTMEKSPSYFVTPAVPERIFRMSKSVKLIVIVRDPTRRAISDYAQSLERKPDNPSFEETVIKDPRTGQINVQWSKIEIGHYAKHLKRWLRYFPSDQLLFVSGEELIERPAQEIKLVEKFLNLEPFISEKNFYYNESKGFPCFVGKITNDGSVGGSHCMGNTKGRKHPSIRSDVLQRLRDYFRPFNEEFYSLVNRNFHWP